MTEDEKLAKVREVAESMGLTVGIQRDGCTQVMLTEEHQKISGEAVHEFYTKLDGFTAIELAAIFTGMLAQWAGTCFPSSEVALKVLGGVFEGASVALAQATEQGLTNWAPENQTLN